MSIAVTEGEDCLHIQLAVFSNVRAARGSQLVGSILDTFNSHSIHSILRASILSLNPNITSNAVAFPTWQTPTLSKVCEIIESPWYHRLFKFPWEVTKPCIDHLACFF